MDVDEYERTYTRTQQGRKIPPGYAGHLPGTRTHTFGKTFGSSVEAVDSAFLSTVRNGRLPSAGKPDKPLIGQRVERTNPVVPRIPGYAGFIPGARNHVYSHTYAQSCRKGALAEAELLSNGNPTNIVECVDERPLVLTQPSDLAMASSGKLKATEMREETREYQVLKKAREFIPGQPIKEVLPEIAQDTTGILPGYGGFIPAEQHIYSQTKGNTTRMLNSCGPAMDPKLRACTFRGYGADKPLIEELLQGAPLPGYTGYVPGRTNHVFGQSFSREMESAGTAHHAILDKSVPQSWRLPNTMPLLGDERPNGLFHTLQAGTTTFGSTAMQVQRGKVPGYTGHLPGLKHTFGSTYGSMEPSMPSDPPKATHKFHVVTDGQIKAPDSLPPASRGRIPGYTGHVPKQLRTYGVTYGTMDSRSALTA